MCEQPQTGTMKQELMLQINQALLDQGIITRDLYEKAKARIVSGQ